MLITASDMDFQMCLLSIANKLRIRSTSRDNHLNRRKEGRNTPSVYEILRCVFSDIIARDIIKFGGRDGTSWCRYVVHIYISRGGCFGILVFLCQQGYVFRASLFDYCRLCSVTHGWASSVSLYACRRPGNAVWLCLHLNGGAHGP